MKSGIQLRYLLIKSGTGVAKFQEFVDHLFVDGDVPAEQVVEALKNADRDLTTTIAKAERFLDEIPDDSPVEQTEPEVKETIADVIASVIQSHPEHVEKIIETANEELLKD